MSRSSLIAERSFSAAGCDICVSGILSSASNTDPVSAIRSIADGGVEFSFEAVGLKVTAEQAYECLAPGGVATIVGMVPLGQQIELDGISLLLEKRIQGCLMGSNRFRIDMPRLIDFYLRAAQPRRHDKPPRQARGRKRSVPRDEGRRSRPHSPDVRLAPFQVTGTNCSANMHLLRVNRRINLHALVFADTLI